MSELSIALSNPATGAAITAFARTALAATAAAVLAPEVGTIIAVAGAYAAVGAAYYAWKQTQNDQLQAIAMTKLCSGANPILSCGDGYLVHYYSENINRYDSITIKPGSTNKEDFIAYEVVDQDKLGISYGSARFRYSIYVTYGDGRYYGWGNINPTTVSESPLNRKPWKEWTSEERQRAISELSDTDWNQVLNQIASEGTLQPGQTLPNDAITLDNGQVQSAGTKALTAEQHAIREAIKPELDKINSDIAKNAAAIAAIAGTLGLVGATIGNIDKNIANLGNVATQTRQAVDGVGAKIDAARAEANDKFNDLKKRSKNISLSLNIDRLLLLMTWWQTLHNCMMLSADIGRSLVSSVEVALAALPGDSLLGIPTEDPDGTPLDVGKTISTSFEGFVKGAVGAENYAELKVELAQINRIYQASSNLLNSVQQLTNDLQNLTELCGENVSRIGNSLISFGVVGEDAYRRMPEDLDTRTSWVYKLQENLEKGQQLAGNIEAIAQSVYSTEQTLIEITQKTTEFRKAIAEVQPKQAIENKPLTEKAQTDKQDSQSPEISKADLESAPTA